MVYFRKRRVTYRKRRGGALNRLTKPRRKTAVQQLAKQVLTLRNNLKRDTEYLNYGQTWNLTNLSLPFAAFHLNSFTNWANIFGTTASDNTNNAAIWKSSGLDLYFSTGNENALTTFTVFLLHARDEAANLISSTGSLSMSSGDAYYAIGSQTMINKKYFKILNVKRFQLGNNGQPASTSTAQLQYGIERRMYMKFRPNKKITNPGGDWKDLGRSLDPSGNYYLVVFNDNSSADLEYPTLSITAVHTVQKIM